MRKVFAMAGVALLSLSLVTGCGTAASAPKASTEPIKVGGDLELSGGTAMFGQAAEKAIKLAFDQQNAKGGVLGGRQLEYVSADNKSDAGESTSAATKLATQDKVAAILGPMTSGDTLAAAQVVSDNKVPLITPTGTADKVTVENGQLKPWIFRACFIDPFQGQVAADFAYNNLKLKKAAVFIDQKGDYSKGLAAAFEDNFKKSGGEVVAKEQYVAGSDKDFRATLTRIKAANPDVVFVPGYYQEVGLIVKQAREMQMNQVFLGGDGWGSPQLVDVAGKAALENTYYVNHGAMDDPGMAQFAKDFKAKYNSDPDTFAALGYDAANMFIKALESAGSTDPEKLRSALETTKDFQGVSGVLTVDPKTHNPVKSAAILQFKDGKSVFMTKINPK
jgi:ABC-type branched-chain amino acid transport systems, periplasmic component